jgi:hypothetical protein
MTTIDYTKKLKIIKKIYDIHLTEKHIEKFFEIYDITEESRNYQYSSCLYVWENNERKFLEDLANVWILDRKKDALDISFRISTKWIALIERIKDEENKWLREKILYWANKQSPLRPFISIIIAIVALVVAIFRS